MRALLVLIALLMPFSAHAADDAAFRRNVIEYLEITGTVQPSMQGLKETSKSIQVDNPVAQDKIAGALDRAEQKQMARYERLIEVYMDVYTPDEMEKILEFYRTPAGKKHVDGYKQIQGIMDQEAMTQTIKDMQQPNAAGVSQ